MSSVILKQVHRDKWSVSISKVLTYKNEGIGICSWYKDIFVNTIND